MNPWLLVAIIAFAISAIALVVGIIIFFRFNIPDVIGDLSGKTLEREISAIREGNSKSGRKKHKHSPVNNARGPITDKVTSKKYDASAISQGHKSKRLDNVSKPTDGDETLPLSGEATMPLQEPGTMPLQSDATMPLEEPGTMPLQSDATMPLQEPGTMPLQEQGTSVLQEGTITLENSQMQKAPANINFKVTETVMLVNTEENIND